MSTDYTYAFISEFLNQLSCAEVLRSLILCVYWGICHGQRAEEEEAVQSEQ